MLLGYRVVRRTETANIFGYVNNVLVYSQISPNVQSPYGHGPQKYNTVAQSEAHSENSQSTRSLFT